MDFYTVEELAEKLKISERTIREKARAGILPGCKAFGRWYFLQVDLVEWMKEQQKKPDNRRA